MGVIGVLLLTLSNVTPATSLYVVAPGIIQEAGSGAVIAMVAAALVSLALAYVYAELCSAYPLAGGEYAILGRVIGPGIGFALMVANAVSFALIPAVLALGAGGYVSAIWPAAPRLAVALGITAASMALGVLNIRLNAWVTGLFLLVEVLTLGAVAALGFAHAHRGVLELFSHPLVLTGAAVRPAPARLIGLGVATAVFAYFGFGQAVYFGEELHEAPRKVARTILLALALTVVFEFLPMAALFAGAPDMRSLLASSSPFSDFLREVGGRDLDVAVSLGVALAAANAVLVGVLISARFLYSTGRDRIWPARANLVLAQIHPRFDSPHAATLISGASMLAACFLPIDLLLVVTSNGVVLLYVCMCVGAMIGRVNGRTAHGAYRMPFYPLAPLAGLLALGWVTYATWLDPTVGRWGLVVNFAIVAGAWVFYPILRARRGADWRLAEPGD